MKENEEKAKEIEQDSIASPQEAAAYFLSILPKTEIEGFDCYTLSGQDEMIFLGPAVEYEHFKGLLKGVALGTSQFGDARIATGAGIVLAALEEEASAENTPLEKVKAIHELAASIAKATGLAAQYGLTSDKVPFQVRPKEISGFQNMITNSRSQNELSQYS